MLDIHDGELMPALENRKTFVRLNRQREVTQRFARRAESVANQYRAKLIELYGEERGKKNSIRRRV